MNAFASIEHRITGERVRIGSAADNDLILAHKSVSARHAVIRNTRRGCYVRDLQSTNGTFLNGRPVEREELLRAGDELRFGAARFAMVAGPRAASRLMPYVGGTLGLIVLAAVGYLAVNFVHNWENLEQMGSASAAKPAASASVNVLNAPPLAPHANPAAPNESVAATAASGPPAWLATINEYRAEVKLAPVAEEPRLSDADRKHAMYVVKNYEDKVSAGHLLGAEMHDETKGNAWYSPEGSDAGAQSDVNQLWGYATPPSPMWALDEWMSGPFHRLWILNPRLHRVGYGEFCEKRYCVAALDLGSGATSSDGASPLPAPIEFPADKSITTLSSLEGEWPSPLTACAGFSTPAGLPATIALGAMVDAKLSEYQIAREGHAIEACAVDADTYKNPIAAEQERGRAILHEMGAAMIIPRYPLVPGHYAVTATLKDHAYQWSFTVASAKAAPPSHEEAAASSKLSDKEKFEATLREGYAVADKPDDESRDEYERDIKQQKLAAVKNAATRAEETRRRAEEAAAAEAKKQAAIEAKFTAAAGGIPPTQPGEIDRNSASAFPAGPGAPAAKGPNQWLSELNRARAAAGLSALMEVPALDDGALKHSKYLVINYPTPSKGGPDMHSEDPTKPGYTTEGLAAAKGNVAPFWYAADPAAGEVLEKMEPLMFLNGWLEAPFHRMSMLRPDIHQVGFAEFCQSIACASVLDTPEARVRVPSAKFDKPIFFPPPKYPIGLDSLPSEWPNPLRACPNYVFPVGVTITIQLGTNLEAKLNSYALMQNAKPVEACGLDASTYTSPDPVELQSAVGGMKLNGEVVIVPRKPLTRGATYEVSAMVNDQPYRWSFTVSK